MHRRLMAAWLLLISGGSALAAPGEVPPAMPVFTDITEASGIDFVHVNGDYGERYLPETIGGGVAFLDYDRDGHQDLLFVNSRNWPDTPVTGSKKTPTSALYRNRGDGRFEDVTARLGLAIHTYGMGVAVGDFDSDGWEDLYITSVEENILLRNEQGKRFVDVTRSAGVAGGSTDWSTAAAFVDIDRDGDLDLLALNYVDWSLEFDRTHPFEIMGIGRSYRNPALYRGAQPLLFENTGEGEFRDISARLVVTEHGGEPVYRGLGIALIDIDGNQLPDIFVANDSSRNVLLINQGGGEFVEKGIDAGIAFDSGGGSTAAMGIDAGWRNGGKALQVVIGNFTWEMSSYYLLEEGGTFADESLLSGFGPQTRNSLTFGVFFFDYDLDGVADILHANGHIEPSVDTTALEFGYAQPPQLFRGCADDTCPAPFVEVAGGAEFSRPMVGRGAAYADIDSDGDQDVIITQAGGPPRLLRNDQRSGNNWLRIRLRDGNRPVLGSTVILRTGTAVQHQRLEVSRSYLSSVENVLTFGLGRADQVQELQVRWPDGSVQQVQVEEVNRLLEISRARSSAPEPG